MLLYSSTKSGFVQDVCSNSIETKILDVFRRVLGHSTSQSKIDPQRNSMLYMNNVVHDRGIPDNAVVRLLKFVSS